MNQVKLLFYRVLLLVACIFWSDAINAYDFEVDGLCYNILSSNQVEVTYKKYNDQGYSGELAIPDKVKYGGKEYVVSVIGFSAFYGCSGLTGSLIIPSSVISIGVDAFNGCSGFTGSLIIPSSVTSIDDRAFNGCRGLTSLVLPSSVTSINGSAFMYCKRLSYVESKMETPFSFGDDIFLGIASNAILVIPKGESYPYGITKWFAEVRWASASYVLSISSSGNGYASYNGTSIRNKTTDFSLTDGTSATITFSPDNGYRIKSVKVNNSIVSVSNNQYTIRSINANTTVSVEFEAIPVTTYTLSITASGNGSASYSGTTIRSKTSTFTVNAGSSATITFTPDNGYRIKNVKVNNTTVSVSNNQYTVSNINANTTVSVEFEAIPPTTYTLSITASGNGSVSYGGTTIRSKTSSFTLNAGSSATITFSPDNGYQIKNVKVNNSTVTVSDNQYTISSINANTTVSVEFEAIPVTYTLSITASGNGSASYDGTTIRSKTSSFTVNEGTTVKISITPDNGYRIKSVKENNTVVTSYVSNGIYTINSLSRNTTVEVEFEEILQGFSVDDVNYTVVSFNQHTIRLAKGDYGITLKVPAKVSYQNTEWTVTGVDNGALANNPDLAAIIWHPDVAFTEDVSNPNLLLYVNKADYAPSNILNVVVDGVAENIILQDAVSGNNFYCPQAFTALRISYDHYYWMTTGIGETRGWDTIALPFDVQKIIHKSNVELVPFANWKSSDTKRPFWLMQLTNSGWKMAESIKANTPYIISMPNNPEYKSEFRMNGNVAFLAENVTIAKTENLQTANYSDRSFIPSYSNLGIGNGAYTLNVVNEFINSIGGATEGSRFILDLRPVHPFEAYMTSTSSTRSIGIDEGMMTGIIELTSALSDEGDLRIYNLNGQLIKIEEGRSQDEVVKELPAGVYVVNGHIIIIK